MDENNSSVPESGMRASPEERKRKRYSWQRMLRPGVVLLLLVAAGFLIWRYLARSQSPPAVRSADGAVQVVAAQAHKGDIGVYVTGLVL